ncbi:trypsin alpha-4-like isoform X2 [Amblyomma americanum]
MPRNGCVLSCCFRKCWKVFGERRALLATLFLLFLAQCLHVSGQAGKKLTGLLPGEVGLNHKSCGIPSIDFRIVNGLAADIQRFPWVVFLQVRYRTIVTRCAGAILTSRHILTAGHCTIWTNNQRATSIIMLYGAAKFFNGTKVGVKYFYRHEDFDFSTFKNDLAVLYVEKPFKLGPSTRTICLPQKPQSIVGETVVVAGWGVTVENGTGSPVLRYTTQVVWENNRCVQGLAGIGFYTPEQICAYKKGSDACQGDSGAPVVRKKHKAFEIVGLVSFGEGCNQENIPVIYTNLTNYLDWIKAAVANTNKYEVI